MGPAPPVQSETWETTESPLLRSLPPSPAQPACPPSQAETWDPTEPQRRSSSQYSRASASSVEPELRDSLRDSARGAGDAPAFGGYVADPNAAEEPTQAHTYGRVPPDDAPAPMEPAKKDSLRGRAGAAAADAARAAGRGLAKATQGLQAGVEGVVQRGRDSAGSASRAYHKMLRENLKAASPLTSDVWYVVKHPAARVAVAALVWLLNLYVYYGDPATYSNGESYGTMIGDIYHGWLLCGNQPVVWVVLTKLQNSLARPNRRRFG